MGQKSWLRKTVLGVFELKLCIAVLFITLAVLPSTCLANLEINGTVVDPEGNPIHDVKVYVSILDRSSIGSTTTYIKGAAVTDAEGRFYLSPMKLPDRTVTLLLAAFEPDTWLGWRSFLLIRMPRYRDTILETLKDPVQITVSKPGGVQGKVTLDTGEPLSGVEMSHELFRPKATDIPAMPHATADSISGIIKLNLAITDEQGIYRLTSVPEHLNLFVSAKKPGYAMIRTYARTSEQADVVMVPGGSLSGKLVDEKGDALAGKLVIANTDTTKRIGISSSDETYSHGRSITASDGSFFIDGLAPGFYRLDINSGEPHNIQIQVSDVQVHVGETTEMADYFLGPIVQVTGRVLDADSHKPVPDASVSVRAEHFRSFSVVTGRDGTYKLSVLPGGMSISYSGGNPAYFSSRKPPTWITVNEEGLEDHIISLAMASIASGMVVDSSGKPVEGVSVSIGEGSRDTTVVSDAEGAFELYVPAEDQISGG